MKLQGFSNSQVSEIDRARRLRKETKQSFINCQVSKESSGEAVTAGCAGASSRS